MTAPFRITSTSLSSITSYIVQYILTWLHLTHTTLLVFHSRMLGRNLSPGTTKMGGEKRSNPLQRSHGSGTQRHWGTTSCRAISRQQLRRNTTSVLNGSLHGARDYACLPKTTVRDHKHTSTTNRPRGVIYTCPQGQNSLDFLKI